MHDDTRLAMLTERIENLEEALDQGSAVAVYARCYAAVTTLMIVLTVVPLTGSNFMIWSVPGGTGSVATAATWTLLVVMPLLFLLLCVTLRPGRSPWLGAGIAGLAVAATVSWWITMDTLSDARKSVQPAGWALLVLLLLTALLGFVHAVHQRRLVPSDQLV